MSLMTHAHLTSSPQQMPFVTKIGFTPMNFILGTMLDGKVRCNKKNYSCNKGYPDVHAPSTCPWNILMFVYPHSLLRLTYWLFDPCSFGRVALLLCWQRTCVDVRCLSKETDMFVGSMNSNTPQEVSLRRTHVHNISMNTTSDASGSYWWHLWSSQDVP